MSLAGSPNVLCNVLPKVRSATIQYTACLGDCHTSMTTRTKATTAEAIMGLKRRIHAGRPPATYAMHPLKRNCMPPLGARSQPHAAYQLLIWAAFKSLDVQRTN